MQAATGRSTCRSVVDGRGVATCWLSYARPKAALVIPRWRLWTPKASRALTPSAGLPAAMTRIKGSTPRKRFVITDTLGLLLAVLVRPADVWDRAGATTLLLGLYLQSGCRMVFADQGFAGRLVAWARQVLGIIVYIVGKPAGQLGFGVHPRRWVAERTLGWLLAHRRLARDYERRPEISEAMIRWAAIGLLVRRLARGQPAQWPGPRPLERVR